MLFCLQSDTNFPLADNWFGEQIPGSGNEITLDLSRMRAKR